MYAFLIWNTTYLKNGGSHHSQNSFIENENIGNSSQRLKSISESVRCSRLLLFHNSVLNSFNFHVNGISFCVFSKKIKGLFMFEPRYFNMVGNPVFPHYEKLNISNLIWSAKISCSFVSSYASHHSCLRFQEPHRTRHLLKHLPMLEIDAHPRMPFPNLQRNLFIPN